MHLLTFIRILLLLFKKTEHVSLPRPVHLRSPRTAWPRYLCNSFSDQRYPRNIESPSPGQFSFCELLLSIVLSVSLHWALAPWVKTLVGSVPYCMASIWNNTEHKVNTSSKLIEYIINKHVTNRKLHDIHTSENVFSVKGIPNISERECLLYPDFQYKLAD